MRRAIVAFVLAAATGGCGLISSDVTETPFDLPQRMYSFDSSTFPVPGGVTSEVPCGAGQLVVDCCNPPAPLPAPDCTTTPLSCEQNENGMNVCTATVTVSQSQMINFGQEVSQLSGLAGFVEIKIKRISYVVTNNTLNIDLPDVALYLAPQGTTSPSDSSARKFGTMPAIPAMTMPAGDVVLEPDAGQTLKAFTQDITQPISFIAATTVRVTHSPAGRIDLTITGKLATSL